MHKTFDVNVGRMIILQIVISECFKAEATQKQHVSGSSKIIAGGDIQTAKNSSLSEMLISHPVWCDTIEFFLNCTNLTMLATKAFRGNSAKKIVSSGDRTQDLWMFAPMP